MSQLHLRMICTNIKPFLPVDAILMNIILSESAGLTAPNWFRQYRVQFQVSWFFLLRFQLLRECSSEYNWNEFCHGGKYLGPIECKDTVLLTYEYPWENDISQPFHFYNGISWNEIFILNLGQVLRPRFRINIHMDNGTLIPILNLNVRGPS